MTRQVITGRRMNSSVMFTKGYLSRAGNTRLLTGAGGADINVRDIRYGRRAARYALLPAKPHVRGLLSQSRTEHPAFIPWTQPRHRLPASLAGPRLFDPFKVAYPSSLSPSPDSTRWLLPFRLEIRRMDHGNLRSARDRNSRCGWQLHPLHRDRASPAIRFRRTSGARCSER